MAVNSGSSKSKQALLGGRYVYSKEKELGKGAFGTVCKGLDTVNCVNVAIKFFAESSQSDFAKAIAIYENISDQAKSNSGSTMWDRQNSCDNSLLRKTIMAELTGEDAEAVLELIQHLDISECMVRLLDHSRESDGRSGLDPESGLLFMIFEMGEMSLRDRLDMHLKDGDSIGAMPETEVKRVLWSLVCIMWALHTIGFVHLDVKPENIMFFKGGDGRGHWKLIDVDGAVPAGSIISPDACHSPMYASPELARFILSVQRKKVVQETTQTTSRLMDVWSTGMVAMEAMFLQPVLEPFFIQWKEETGSLTKFYAWLADEKTEPIVSGDMKDFIHGIDANLCSLLQNMLYRDPQQRFCMAQCLLHPYFKGQRRGPVTPRGGLDRQVSGDNPDKTKGGWDRQVSQDTWAWQVSGEDTFDRQVTPGTSMARRDSIKRRASRTCAVM